MGSAGVVCSAMKLASHVPSLAFVLATLGATLAWTDGRAQGDRPLEITQLYETPFPATLSMQGISAGRVQALIKVDPPDRLIDWLVVGYTHPELAQDFRLHIESWRFSAPWVGGEPASARALVEFAYSARGIVLSVSPSDAMNQLIGHWVEPAFISLVCRADQLDRPLAPLRTEAPRHPGQLAAGAPRATATVDFYVDGEGRPRLAVATSFTHEVYGAAAVAAIERWRFAPPTRDGQPVLVRVRQNFVFADRRK